MTEEKRKKANDLAYEISEVKESLSYCNMMLENHHDCLRVVSTLTFRVPKDIARSILLLSKDALEKQLTKLEKEFDEL